MPAPPAVTDRVLTVASLDRKPNHAQPAPWRVARATVVSIVLSLAADAALVAVGTHLFPSTRGYVHFAFSDYAKLTVVGILIAAAGWPVVTRLTSAPRWLYLRLAVVVSAVLLLPDVSIWHGGQPAKAVAVLMGMHVAIAIITYNALVRLAPVGARHASTPSLD